MDPNIDQNSRPDVTRPTTSNKRFQQTQAQVNEVVDIMRVNMEKVLERDDKLAQLDERADALQAGASQFEASAGKLKNKYWWKNMKMTLALGAVGLILVIALLWYIFGGKSAAVAEATPAAAATAIPPPLASGHGGVVEADSTAGQGHQSPGQILDTNKITSP